MKRGFKTGGDRRRIRNMEGSSRTGQGSWQTIAQVALVVVEVVAAVVVVVVVVVTITIGPIPVRPAQALWVKKIEGVRFLENRHMKVTRFSTLCTGRLYHPWKIYQVLISVKSLSQPQGPHSSRKD